MPRPTELVKQVCYAGDITVWASGVLLPVLEDRINDYLEEITVFLDENLLLLSAPKSTVTLFNPDTKQAKTHLMIVIEDTALPLVQSPIILGVHLDITLAFYKHCNYVADRVLKRKNVLKAISGTTWGQQKGTLLMTYKLAIGRLIMNYGAPTPAPPAATNYR